MESSNPSYSCISELLSFQFHWPHSYFLYLYILWFKFYTSELYRKDIKTLFKIYRPIPCHCFLQQAFYISNSILLISLSLIHYHLSYCLTTFWNYIFVILLLFFWKVNSLKQETWFHCLQRFVSNVLFSWMVCCRWLEHEVMEMTRLWNRAVLPSETNYFLADKFTSRQKMKSNQCSVTNASSFWFYCIHQYHILCGLLDYDILL